MKFTASSLTRCCEALRGGGLFVWVKKHGCSFYLFRVMLLQEFIDTLLDIFETLLDIDREIIFDAELMGGASTRYHYYVENYSPTGLLLWLYMQDYREY